MFCLPSIVHTHAQTPVVTMSSAKKAVTIHVEWKGDGSLVANNVVLKKGTVVQSINYLYYFYNYMYARKCPKQLYDNTRVV